jgi:coenzyme F420 hydrogenase subunit beta
MSKDVPSVEKVILSANCVGYGACAVVSSRRLSIGIDDNGFLAPDPSSLSIEDRARASHVCLFSDNENESEIGPPVFSNHANAPCDDTIGFSISLKSGHALTERARGSSGEIATWLLKRLVRNGTIDHAIHVARTPDDQTSFGNVVSSTPPKIEAGATSFYHPVQLRNVLDHVRQTPGRYPITVTPCFAKALRLLMASDPKLKERIVYLLAIVCGQLKTTWYPDYLSRRAGADGPLTDARFRRKLVSRPANRYLLEATYRSQEQKAKVAAVSNKAVGTNWGMGYFTPRACGRYCDDVFAETADIARRDAWLPRLVGDWQETTLMVVRDPSLNRVLMDGEAQGKLEIADMSYEEADLSHPDGLDHRRPGLRHRLPPAKGRWEPTKRVIAFTAFFRWPFKLDQRMRLFLRAASFHAFGIQRSIGGGIQVFGMLIRGPILMFKGASRIWAKRQANSSIDCLAERNYHLDRVRSASA